MRGCWRALQMGLDDLGEVMGVDHDLLHADGAEAVDHGVDHAACRPPRTIGFGTVSVSGRRRVPKPAASTMARGGWPSAGRVAGRRAAAGLVGHQLRQPRALRRCQGHFCGARQQNFVELGRAPRGSGDMAIEPGADRRQRRMGEVIFDAFPGARDVADDSRTCRRAAAGG